MRCARSVIVLVFCVVLYISQASGQTQKKPSPTAKKPTTPKPTVAPGLLKCSVYNVTIKLTNITFGDDFQNPHSKDFINTRIELEAGIHQAFDGYRPFTAIKVHQFTKAGDGKILAHVYLEFKANGTHLKNLTGAISKGTIGKLPCQPTLIRAACYKIPPVAACSYPCPALCAPDCSSPCCGQYQVPSYSVPPPPVMLPPPPPPPQCAPSCSPACAPTCSPACCQTSYAAGPYGKRHDAPKPNKEDINKLKKHLLKKHNKKATKTE